MLQQSQKRFLRRLSQNHEHAERKAGHDIRLRVHNEFVKCRCRGLLLFVRQGIDAPGFIR